MLAKYYVYRLIDPRTNTPFYIGKGSGRRAWQHLSRSYGHRNLHKQERVRDIRSSGGEPLVDIIRDQLSECEALEMERALIVEHRAILTNIASGDRAPALRGFGRAHRALCALLQLKRREDVPHTHLNDYDRMRAALINMVIEPFERLMDSPGAS